MKKRLDAAFPAEQWIERAENDLRNAQYTLTLKENCPFDTVCFHAQQSVEKYLKALLLKFSVDFPKTHDLRVLLQIAEKKASLKFDKKRVLLLNRYVIEGRYPGDWDPITRSEAEEAVQTAKATITQIRDIFEKI